MIGVIRKAMLFACAGVLVASAAMAAVPSPANSSIPCGGGSPPGGANSLWLVGTNVGGTTADPHGAQTITVRDFAGNPIAGSAVVIDFTACLSASDMGICSVQPVSSGVSTYCGVGTPQLNAVTGPSGDVTFKVVGGAHNNGAHVPGVSIKCGEVYADGVHLGTINVAACDQDGNGKVNPADVSASFTDSLDYTGSGGAIFRARTDLDCNGKDNPADISLLFVVSLGGASGGVSCSPYCN